MPALLELRRAVRGSLTPVVGTIDGVRTPGIVPTTGARVLVALSGGADSVGLLAAALAESEQLGATVGAVVVDHGLQEGSAQVAADAAQLAEKLGAAPVEVVRVEVGRTGGPEAAARDARYAALADAARRHGAAAVLLGHTRDDQAETVLLGLARGSGARSLAGMRDRTERDGVAFLRPFLHVARATTREACAELGIDVWDDPHNVDPAYTRSRVRHDVLPVLTEVLGAGAVPALARSADLLRDDADALDVWAERARADAEAGDEDGLDVVRLAELPAAVRRRVLRAAAIDAGANGGALTAAHLDAVDALVARWTGQGAIALPGPVAAARSCGRLTFRGC